MIISYNRMPSARFTERVRAVCIHDEDWLYLSECIDAKNRAGRLMAYLKQCAQSGMSYPSADVICYILCDTDFDDFKIQVNKKNQ